jgi:long-chain acyl-CoA synthetase
MLTSEQDNFVKMYQNSFRNNWDREAITDYGTTNTLTYSQLAALIARLHILFKQYKIKKDEKIAVMGKNNCNWVAVYLATVTYGGIIVPILQDFKANDAQHIINHSGAKLLFVSDLIWEGMDLDQLEEVKAVYSLANFKLLARTHKEFTWGDVEDLFLKQYPNGFTKEDVVYDERDNGEVASINYTSGTTGFSKGVITPCNALAAQVKFFGESGYQYPGCRHVAFLPLAHAYGCIVDFLGSLAHGGHTYFIGRTPSPKLLLQAFAEVKPTAIVSVPLIVEKIYKKQIAPQIAKPPVSWVMKVPFLDEVVLGKIRQQLINAFGGEFKQLILGGAPLNSEVEAFFRRIKFPLTVGYGMTECAPLITVSFYPDVRTYSCGKILEGYMEMRIDSPNEEGIGEIQVRGENLMYGYYRNAQATADTFTQDGWLKTGDLGYIDKDGFLFIKGRNKSMLLGANGQNIYPEEIETKLNNMPYVLESLVIQQKDSSLVALVCPDYDAVDAVGLDHEALDEAMEKNRRDLNAQIAAYEQINKIKLFPHEFEKTPKKSIKRFLYTSLEES